jgi:hypothetical protein
VGVTGHADVGVAGRCLACIVVLADQHHRHVGPSAVSPRRTDLTAEHQWSHHCPKLRHSRWQAVVQQHLRAIETPLVSEL